jgi:hypothetical protein
VKRAPWLAVAAVAAAALSAPPAHAGDPARVWRTIESEHFVVHYYEPNGDLGRRVALVAERAHRTLAVAFDHEPEEKCHILLLDDTDGANGFANVLPRNSITLFATAPAGGSTLNDHDDWLYSLTAHEYTHVLHLDTIEGLPYWYNKVFGKTWAPNQVMPRWIIEGIATYEETKRSAGGRGRNATFDMFLRVPVLQHEMLTLDQTTGAPRKFPRGNAAYLYGSKFLEYVFDRFGDDTLRRMSHASAKHPLPFAVNRQIASVVGTPFDALYGDWERHLRDRYALQAEAIDRRGRRDGRLLTADDSNTDVAPVYGADGKELYWLRSDGYERARIHAMPVGGDARTARRLPHLDGIGAWTLAPDGSVAFEQSRVYRRDYSYQDVSYWDRRDDRTVRITVGKRAQDPAVSPDGREVAFAMNASARRVVAVAPIAPDAEPTVVWRGAGRYDQAFAPAWSPDGARLAFSAWRDGGLRDILVVDRRTGAVEEITRDRAIDGSPTWSPDGRYLYFDSDRTGVSNIYAWDTAQRRLWQVTNVLGGALEASASPDGRRLAFHDFTGDGFDLKEVDLDPATWRPARAYVDVRPEPTVIRDDDAAVTKPRPYRALETLAPQAWTGQLTLGTLERAASVTTQGSDIAGLHGYAFGASIDLERGDVDFGASYGYTKLRIPIRISGARSVTRRGGYRIEDVNRLFDEEQLGATVSFGVPAERWPGGNWALSFDYDLDWSRALTDPLMELDPNDNVPVKPLTDVVQAGVAARLSFGSATGALYSTGPNYGYELAASTRLDHPSVGADYRALTVSWNGRVYTRVPWGKTPTIMVRYGGAVRTSDIPRTGAFSLGGGPRHDVVAAILDSSRVGNTGVLRGYPARVVTGNQFHLLNLEYRHELYNIERGLATLPAYFKRVHVAGLVDAGTAWDRDPAWDRVKLSAGGVLRVDAFFGFFVPGTFELGYARGLTDEGVNETWFTLSGTI